MCRASSPTVESTTVSQRSGKAEQNRQGSLVKSSQRLDHVWPGLAKPDCTSRKARRIGKAGRLDAVSQDTAKGVEPWNKKQKVPSRPVIGTGLSTKFWTGTSLNYVERRNGLVAERRNGSPSVWLFLTVVTNTGVRDAFRAEAQAERKRGRSRRPGEETAWTRGRWHWNRIRAERSEGAGKGWKGGR